MDGERRMDGRTEMGGRTDEQTETERHGDRQTNRRWAELQDAQVCKRRMGRQKIEGHLVDG